MAKQTVTTLVDDLDNGEATQTVSFGWAGTSYEIDLNDKNAAAFEKAINKYVAAARKATPAASTRARAASSTSTKRTDLDEVRTWARSNGHEVSDRGRVAVAVLDAYDAAHG